VTDPQVRINIEPDHKVLDMKLVQALRDAGRD